MIIPASELPAGDADCIIFDCDGVLVDVSGSYYMAIKETVRHILAQYPEHAFPNIDAACAPHVIEGFKSAGTFNDEIDLSCAIVLCVMAACSDVQTGTKYNHVVDDVICDAAKGGIARVISYVAGMDHTCDDILRAISYMEHPSYDRSGRLCRIFDQIFFGAEMYRRVRGRDFELAAYESGTIKNDRLIIRRDVLGMLSEAFGGRVSMVTGRGLESARHALGPLFEMFDMDNSAFLEDEPREHAKPNPARLDECIRGMGAKRAVYVGDSVEDAMMARDASSHVAFCAITGTSSDAEARHTSLKRAAQCSDILVCDTVCDIPKALKIGVQL